MEVLHLTTEPPYFPGGSGGATRQFFLLARLVERGHRVRVLAPETPARREQSRLDERCAGAGIELHVIERDERRGREAARAFLRDPRTVGAAFTQPWHAWRGSLFLPDVRARLRELLAARLPDVVTVDHDHLAHWGSMPELAGLPRVLSTHNASWCYYARRAQRRGPHVSRARDAVEARRAARLVRRWAPVYERVVATSSLDAERFAAVVDRPIDVVHNGADFATFLPTPPLERPPTAVFTGTLSHPPNVHGIVWFVREVWPLVRAQLPDARFRVVGREATPAVREATAVPGVELVGAVPDIRPWLAESTIAVVPLHDGGGTRLKIAEALACGRAVVSTTIGAEGLDLEPGRHLLVADAPDAFATATIRALTDPALRARLARDGREEARRRYAWQSLGDCYAAALEQACGRRRPQSTVE